MTITFYNFSRTNDMGETGMQCEHFLTFQKYGIIQKKFQ